MEERFEEKDQLRVGEIELLKETIQQMSEAQTEELDAEVEDMKTQLNNLQQLLDQSNLEKTMLQEAKPETAENYAQTDKFEDSFFRNITMTPEGVTYEELQNLMHEAVELADQSHKAKDKLQKEFNELKAKYEEAEETLAFLNAEKQCNNDVVDDLNRENSSLKDQLKDLSSLSSGINNSSRMSAEFVKSLEKQTTELKEEIRVSHSQNLEEMLLSSQKSESVLKLKLDIVQDELKQSQEKLDEVNSKVDQITQSLTNERKNHKKSTEEWKQINADLQAELIRALYGKSEAGKLEHSESKKPLSKSEMEELGIEDDSDYQVKNNETRLSQKNQTSSQNEFKPETVESYTQTDKIDENIESILAQKEHTIQAQTTEIKQLKVDCVQLAEIAQKLKTGLADESEKNQVNQEKINQLESDSLELARLRQYLDESAVHRKSLLEKATKNEDQLVSPVKILLIAQ